MINSHKYKFIFTKTSKVGGTSPKMFLSDIYNVNYIVIRFCHQVKIKKQKNLNNKIYNKQLTIFFTYTLDLFIK